MISEVLDFPKHEKVVAPEVGFCLQKLVRNHSALMACFELQESNKARGVGS